jgi:hypothetical protein
LAAREQNFLCRGIFHNCATKSRPSPQVPKKEMRWSY